MSEWIKYTGSDEQIAEMSNNKWIGRFSEIDHGHIYDCSPKSIRDDDLTQYWIIPDDPLREMKIRQAMTGQPVWVRDYKDTLLAVEHNYDEYVTTTPDWNIPTAKYSFTAFED